MPYRFSFVPPRTPLLFPVLAALVATHLAACSTSESAGSGGSEATSTSSTGAGGSTPEARVIVRDHAGRPAVGVDILVHDPTGATTQQTKTDATGAAMVNLASGGGVTALYKTARENSEPGYSAVSVIGLAGGAEVRLVADPDVSTDVPLPMSLSFTGVPPLAPAGWDIVTSCHQEMTASETSLAYGGCAGSSTYDLVAFLSSGDQRIVFAAQPDQPGKSVPFQLDPAKAEAAPRVEVDVKAMPAGTSTLEARLSANRPEGGRTQVSIFQSPIQPQGTLLKIPRLPVSAGGTFDLDVSADTAQGSVLARFPFTAKELPTSPVAWSALAIPYVTSAGPITGSSQRPEVPWALPPGEMPADAVRLVLVYVTGQRPVDWTLYMASSVGATARFPEIPASFPGWIADPGTSLTVLTQHVDVAGTSSLLAAVNADFDRTGSAWSATSFTAAAP
jgi:hypothetical protein